MIKEYELLLTPFQWIVFHCYIDEKLNGLEIAKKLKVHKRRVDRAREQIKKQLPPDVYRTWFDYRGCNGFAGRLAKKVSLSDKKKC